MKIIDQSWEWLQKPDLPLEMIERAGRTCYRSEEKITEGSAEKFAKMILNRGHESVIEHVSATVKFITNRGVMAELTRHRLCSFSIESTRYVRYDGGMEVIKPVWWDQWSDEERSAWENAMQQTESAYRFLIERGSRPEQAREVLPNSLKTTICTTANVREWIHIFKLRTSPQAHPQIRALMLDCLKGFQETIPVIFDNIQISI